MFATHLARDMAIGGDICTGVNQISVNKITCAASDVGSDTTNLIQVRLQLHNQHGAESLENEINERRASFKVAKARQKLQNGTRTSINTWAKSSELEEEDKERADLPYRPTHEVDVYSHDNHSVKSISVSTHGVKELHIMGYKWGVMSMPGIAKSNANRKPIQWLHFSKAGGSFMCDLAREMEKVVVPNDNCNWRNIDGKPLATVDCDQRTKYYNSSGFTYGQIERPFEERDYCPDTFLYGTMLRDPVELAQSRMNFDQVANYREILTCVESQGNCDMFSQYDEWTYFDNFMIRTLLGQQVWLLPPGQINHTHAEAAIQILSKFDLVVLLEDLGQETTTPEWAKMFGWTLTISDREKVNPSEPTIKFTEEEQRRIRLLVEHDYRLYEYVQANQKREEQH